MFPDDSVNLGFNCTTGSYPSLYSASLCFHPDGVTGVDATRPSFGLGQRDLVGSSMVSCLFNSLSSLR